MPTDLESSFLAYGTSDEEGERLVHRQRGINQSDPVMYFNSGRKHAYRFAMDSDSSAHFSGRTTDDQSNARLIPVRGQSEAT